MSHSKIKHILIILIVTFPCIAYAGGSSYSRYGIGDILYYGGNHIYSMGGAGIALVDDEFINRLNPAGLVKIAHTQFSTGIELTRFSSQGENSSGHYSATEFQGLSFAIPVSRDKGITLSLELTPYSSVGYAINHSDSVVGTIRHQTFYGSGGLSYLGLGLSASLFKSLDVGARVNYLFGQTRQYQTSSFDTTAFLPTEFDRSTYYSGFTYTLGAIYEGFHNMALGIIFSTSAKLNANEKRIYSSLDSTTNTNGSADIPYVLGFGLSYVHQNRYRFTGDIVLQNWGTAQYFGSHPVELRNSSRIGLGFEAAPAKDAGTFFKRLTYRGGIAYHSTYYQINGIGINEYLASVGFGIPMGSEAQLNIGLQVGTRGSTNNSLQKDTMVSLSIGISASEIWFLKFEEE